MHAAWRYLSKRFQRMELAAATLQNAITKVRSVNALRDGRSSKCVYRCRSDYVYEQVPVVGPKDRACMCRAGVALPAAPTWSYKQPSGRLALRLSCRLWTR